MSAHNGKDSALPAASTSSTDASTEQPVPTAGASREPAPAPTLDETVEPPSGTINDSLTSSHAQRAPVGAQPGDNPASRPAEPTKPRISTELPPTSPRSAKLTPRTPHFSDEPPVFYTAPPERVNGDGRTASVSPTRQRSSSSRRSSIGLPPSSPRPKPTLLQTSQDLRVLLRTFVTVVPSSLRRLRILVPAPVRRAARFLVHRLAMFLYKRGFLATNVFYDLLVLIWKTVITLFFREIRSRGAWKVPKNDEGAVIFVVGPHHNQFLDPLLLMSEVRREAGRRISFLVAAKSMDRRFIGQAAKLMQSIPVARAQDLATAGKGTISVSSDDPTVIVGTDTQFTKDFGSPRCQIMLPRSLGSVAVEVTEVVDDTHLKIKKEFNKKAVEGLKAKGGAGVAFKVLPHVDQSQMYSSVYHKLSEGGCIGIFPEGGSHDRTDLLPLKAGVSIMALGALSSNPDLKLRIVPVGLSYFHPHRFRSRAVVEFGSPIEIPTERVRDFEKGGEEKKKAIGDVMHLVVDGLKSVTIRAPDYDTLMLIQATRRLYRPPGQHLTLGQIVELNKRFIAGYEAYKEEPRVIDLSKRVKEYNTKLRYLGLKDHQVEKVSRAWWKSFALLAYRLGLVSAWGTLALPGVILNAPIFIAASYISRIKAKEALAASTVKIKGKDVLATWKVLVALAGAPALYTIYAIGSVILAHKLNLPPRYKLWAPIATLTGLPMIGYSALKFGEVGMDVYKSLRPLLLSVVPGHEKQLDKLRTMRMALSQEINELVEELAPKIFEDFHSNRIVPPAAKPAPTSHAHPGMPRRRSTYGPQGQGTFFTHPMSSLSSSGPNGDAVLLIGPLAAWLDEFLFGWSQANSKRNAEDDDAASDTDYTTGTRSGYVSGYTTEEPDYDEVITILSKEQGVDPNTTGALTGTGGASAVPGDLSKYRRNSSRARSRSQLDLTALNKAVSSGVQPGSSSTTTTNRSGHDASKDS
ncbi:Glycerol-3-phosphate/dihydroxyacetone phosphate acyltransferase [Microbotryomycetes sp. JL201]|nr:Glycerol-3-phosphate/dihydroxyacetone phosphate acyltransferase [Microbotryomycetes sp. JL201]